MLQLQPRPKSTTNQPHPFLHPHPSSSTYHSHLIEWPCRLNVRQSLLQILQLQIDVRLGLLCILHSLCLEGLDGLDLPSDIVCSWLECAEVLLDLVDDALVFEDGTVVREVDLLGLLGEDLHAATGVLVALLECLEGGSGLPAKSEALGHLCPVELESCASL